MIDLVLKVELLYEKYLDYRSNDYRHRIDGGYSRPE